MFCCIWHVTLPFLFLIGLNNLQGAKYTHFFKLKMNFALQAPWFYKGIIITHIILFPFCYWSWCKNPVDSKSTNLTKHFQTGGLRVFIYNGIHTDSRCIIKEIISSSPKGGSITTTYILLHLYWMPHFMHSRYIRKFLKSAFCICFAAYYKQIFNGRLQEFSSFLSHQKVSGRESGIAVKCTSFYLQLKKMNKKIKEQKKWKNKTVWRNQDYGFSLNKLWLKKLKEEGHCVRSEAICLVKGECCCWCHL